MFCPCALAPVPSFRPAPTVVSNVRYAMSVRLLTPHSFSTAGVDWFQLMCKLYLAFAACGLLGAAFFLFTPLTLVRHTDFRIGSLRLCPPKT